MLWLYPKIEINSENIDYAKNSKHHTSEPSDIVQRTQQRNRYNIKNITFNLTALI